MSETPPANDPLKGFTFAGRLLMIATVLVAGGLFYWDIMYIFDHFPSGGYPVSFLLLPAVTGAGFFFVAGLLILRLFGIRISHPPDDPDRKP